MTKSLYQSPLCSRYASRDMQSHFSADNKYTTWRRLWIALAEAQKELGLNITDDQLAQMRAHVDQIDYNVVDDYEQQFRHDVMAHIHAFGDLCPLAKPIIHLGATSCYVTDNGDLIQIRSAMKLIYQKLIQVIRQLTHLARKHYDTPCLAFTHFQPAQPTTVGKRICMWLQNFVMDYHQLNDIIDRLPFLGLKGATGTQASILALFENNNDKVKLCDKKIAEKFDFKNLLTITGQTYPRKIDAQILQVLSQIAVSSQKFATDIRLLSNLNEIEEGRLQSQIGSSAMPYKQNPIYSERICSLSRLSINLCKNAEDTAANQWLERTLDDSANKRIVIAESFLVSDSILNLMTHVVSNLEINQQVISRNLKKELPFLATENILMAMVKKGGSRQELHEKLREHSFFAKKVMKAEGTESDLLKRLVNDPKLPLTLEDLKEILDIKKFTGRASSQVKEFLEGDVEAILEKNKGLSSSSEEVSV